MLVRTPPKASTVGRVTRAVADIEVGQRYRHDLGDVQGLAQSIAENGLLHPIPIKPDNTLIAGARRLSAVKLLGWAKVPVTVVNISNIVRGALAENAERKDFLPSEIDAIRRVIEPLEQPAAKERQRASLKRGQQRPVVENCPHGGKTRDKVAAFAGVSGRTVEKIRAVCDAARADPERFGPLVEAMDKSGKVNRFHAELCRALAEQASPPSSPADARVIGGDYREQGNVIADASVQLIFTDPRWEKKYVAEYADLAKFAARVLVDGGSLITYVNQRCLPDILPLMTDQLCYWWIVTVQHSDARSAIMHAEHVFVTWKPLLWFVKGRRRNTTTKVRDSVRSEPGNKTIDHPWAQGLPEAEYYIERLTSKGSLVVDPYLGGGTTGVAAVKLGRRFVGFEIDGEMATKAEARIIRAGRYEAITNSKTTREGAV
jgi:ParB/RepB/Spo0J family partition protein